ncbi:hypothetical protein ASF40_19820 [Microbacterium sp. Leaf288]|uniref:hypothetical protein n=1 Tax=Microbacterium sp. Leaf288 TaxID=1736323 RepID=UPI0006FE51E5|nr:hypothetical protein [Microbacterium sp. Leaf288]KQP68036.1 hypothetical protein ASF40_19820 [Microbacterium sp. Leaf288]
MQIFSYDVAGNEITGSGYLLAPDVVLTASHLVGPSPDGMQVESGLVEGWTSRVTQSFDLGSDVAVLICATAAPMELGERPVVGSLGRAGAVVSCSAAGFPSIATKRSNAIIPGRGSPMGDRAYVRVTHLAGEVSTGTGFTDRSVTMHLDANSRPITMPAPGKSSFAGLSGSALFVGNHLIGVVTIDPSPDHPTVLEGVRIADVLAGLQLHDPKLIQQLAERVPQLSIAPFDDVTIDRTAPMTRAAQRARVQTILEAIDGQRVRGRAAELAIMSDFCANSDSTYLVWHADAWSGKTALLATFVADAPAGIDVVSFFTSRNRPDQRDARAFVESITHQLEAYLGEPPTQSMFSYRLGTIQEGYYFELLRRACEHAAENGRRLVFIVDALDEDEAFDLGPASTPSIASLLPGSIPGLRVIVATRPYDLIYQSLPRHHPMRAAGPLQLTPSSFAAGIEEEAHIQIRQAAQRDDGTTKQILALLAAAGVAMCANDLASVLTRLTDPVNPAQVLQRLQSSLSRAVRRVVPPLGARIPSDFNTAYEWSHETIPGIVRDELSRSYVDQCRTALSQWIDVEQAGGWSTDRPMFFETAYPAVLTISRNFNELARCAVDPYRQDWLRSRLGTDDQAHTEVRDAIEMGIRDGVADMGDLLVLRTAEKRLIRADSRVPDELVRLLIRLGHQTRAISLAGRRGSPHDRAAALIDAARVLAEHSREALAAETLTGVERIVASTDAGDDSDALLLKVGVTFALMRAPEEAFRVVDGINGDGNRGDALRAVATAFAKSGNPDEAQRFLDRIADDEPQVDEWRALAIAFATAGSPQKAHLVLAGIDDDESREDALRGVAIAFAEAGDPDEAHRVVRSIADDSVREVALHGMASAFATAGEPHEVQLAVGGITDETYRDDAWRAVAIAFVEAGLPVEANLALDRIRDQVERLVATTFVVEELVQAQMLTEAESLAGRSADPSEALALVGQAFVANGDVAAASRVFEEAERQARKRTFVSDALSELAVALAAVGNLSDSSRLFAEAERVLGEPGGDSIRAIDLLELVERLATAGHVTDAARLLSRVDLTDRGAEVRGERAVQLTIRAYARAGDAEGADRLARTIRSAWSRADALSGAVVALAENGNLVKARTLANSIPIQHKRDEALSAVAVTLATQGLRGAAEGFLSEIPTYERTGAVVEVAEALADAGFMVDAEQLILAEADRYIDARPADYLSFALAGVAEGLARVGRLTEAERLIDAIAEGTLKNADERERGFGYRCIVAEIARAGNYVEAERIARSVRSELIRAWALLDICKALTESNLRTVATRLLLDAEDVAVHIENDDQRARWYASSASVWAALGRVIEGRRVLDVSESAAIAVSDQVQRALTLTKIAAAAVNLWHIADADRLFFEAEQLADALDRGSMHQILAGIASAQADAMNIGEVTRLAKRLQRTFHHDRVLSSLAIALARGGDTQRAKNTAHGLENQWRRAQAYLDLTMALMDTRNPREAADTRAEALEMVAALEKEAAKVVDPVERASSFMRVAEFFTQLGEFARARIYVLQALSLAPNDTGSGEMWATLAAADPSGWPRRLTLILPGTRPSDP